MSINKLMIKQRIYQEEMKLKMINDEREEIEHRIKLLQEQLEDTSKEKNKQK